MKGMRNGTTGAAVLCGALVFGACAERDPMAVELADAGTALASNSASGPGITLASYSVTPPLVRTLVPGLNAYAIIGSDDVLPESKNFIFGGSADGAGLIRNSNGTFTLLVNHEDNFAVSRITLGRNFRPVKGEYRLNSTVGRFRLCSATLATPAEHGFGPVFITAGESNEESQIHAVDPSGPFNSSTLLTAFGRWNTENAVPLPKEAYPGRTAVIIGDDDSGPFGGQIALYLSDVVGDLQNGKLFALAPADGYLDEREMVAGKRYEVVFKQIPNQQSLTGAEINAITGSLGAFQFGRVEDIDYRKGVGGGRDIYFNVTGQATTGPNAGYTRTKYGRVYRLVLSPKDPLRGALELVLDGDDRSGPAGMFQNPDNILVTRNYVYIQEDPNGYGDETHDSYIYQYDINNKTLRVVMELDHRRNDPYYGGNSTFGSWEYGAMLDVTDQLGGTDTNGTFLIAIQPHTWRGPKYENPDGGTLRPTENQASQIVVVTGLPR